ncbi:MAG: CRISPR-associated protein Cas4 [bacterium]|nr:CRISPR-associated protein Cas4 [bacterium]
MFPDLPTNEDDLTEASYESVMPEEPEQWITITLVKQYIYCPRVVYYETCTPGIRPTTYKMQAGQAAHQQARERAARRKLSAYHLTEGERRFDVRLVSPTWKLSGLIDEVVIAPDEAIVVDYKMANWAGDNHLIQVAAYGLMVEEAFKLPVRRAFIYLMKARTFEMVSLDGALRNSVIETLTHIHHIRMTEYMPPPVDERNKCKSCEFRRFCNDV